MTANASVQRPGEGLDRVLAACLGRAKNAIAILEYQRPALAEQSRRRYPPFSEPNQQFSEPPAQPGSIASPSTPDSRGPSGRPIATIPGLQLQRLCSTTVLWVNAAFAARGSLDPEAVPGTRLGDIAERYAFDPRILDVEDAMECGEAYSTPVYVRRDAATDLWWQISMERVPGSTDRGGELWMLELADVTQSSNERRQQMDVMIAQRQSRRALHVVSQVSDYLVDLDHPYVLREISHLLVDHLGGWFGFYLDDGGLKFSESIIGSGVPDARATIIREGEHTDALGDSQIPGLGTVVIEGPETTEAQDPVAALLTGKLAGPIEFVLEAAYLPGTRSRELAQDLAMRLGALPGQLGTIMLHVVPGRSHLMGLVAAVMPAVEDDAVVFGPTGRVDRSAAWGVTIEGGVTVLELVTRRVGMAIENVHFYRRERAMAETLQRAMLPEQVDIEGLDVWTYYAPASGHAQVGGDWYDVLQMSANVAGIVIGDVVGHDIEAAAAMGQMRSVIRAYAFELVDPAVVLQRTDRLVVGMRMTRPASLVYATLSRLRTGWDMEYARAGHLPPLLVRDGVVTRLNGKGGVLVGYGSGERHSDHVKLVPGDALVFYTDGLIERRAQALSSGLDALCEVAGSAQAIDAAGIGEELLSRLGEDPEDDVALVVVRVPNPAKDALTPVNSPRSRRWALPSEPASIARARHAVLQTGSSWGLTNLADAELVASELVANAVLHGWGHLSFRLFETDAGLRIEVEDANPSPPIATEGHANRSGGYGMQIVERLAEWGWRPAGSGKMVWAQLQV